MITSNQEDLIMKVYILIYNVQKMETAMEIG